MKRIALCLFVILGLTLSAADQFTVQAWVGFPKRVMRDGTYALLCKGHRGPDGSQVMYVLSLRDGYPEFRFLDGKGEWTGIWIDGQENAHEGMRVAPAKGRPNLTYGKPWHHVAGIFSNGTASVYLDGRLAFSATGLEIPRENGFALVIGHEEDEDGNAIHCFAGEIRLPHYEPRALSAEEIAVVVARGAKELETVAPTLREVDYPRVPVKGEFAWTKSYFDRLETVPPAPRASNCVARVVKVNGIPRLEVDGRVRYGMAMMPSPYVDDDDVTSSCRDFSAIGVRFFSNIWWGLSPRNKWWLGEGRYDYDYFDARMRAMIRAAPEGWVFPRIKMDPPPWWQKEHPEEFYVNQVRPDSAAWRDLRTRMLRDIVAHIENSDYAAHVIGYHIGALSGTEWLVFPIPRTDVPQEDAARKAWLDNLSKVTADALLDSAKLVKELTGGRKVVGSFFGYFSALQRDFDRVVSSPYVDFFSAPDVYDRRRGGEPGRSQVAAQASCRLHNKIFWIEADQCSCYVKTTAKYRCETLQETMDVAKRTLGYTLTDGWETWWFLLEGNWAFHDETLLKTIQRGAAVAADAVFSAPPRTEVDVCVFRQIKEYEYGPFAPNPDNNDLYGQFLHTRVLPATGVAYDCYVLEDILSPDLPDYKVYVFPDAKTLTSAQQEAARRLIGRRGRTLVRFCADQEGTVVSPGGFSRVDFTRPPSADTLREVFRKAGAHVWLDGCDIISAGRGFLMVHAASSGVKRIRLPKPSRVTEIYGRSPERRNVMSFDEGFRFGETRIYRLEYDQPRTQGKDTE